MPPRDTRISTELFEKVKLGAKAHSATWKEWEKRLDFERSIEKLRKDGIDIVPLRDILTISFFILYRGKVYPENHRWERGTGTMIHQLVLRQIKT